MVTSAEEIEKTISSLIERYFPILKEAEKQSFMIQKKGGDSFERSGIQRNRPQYPGHGVNDVTDDGQTGLGKVRRGSRL